MPRARDRWAAFHAAHFEDAARRAWFAAHLVPRDVHTREELEDAYTACAPGESDASWQARYGLVHLTPGAARVFDRSRRFRAARAAADDAVRAPRVRADEDLAALRAHALRGLRAKRPRARGARRDDGGG